MPTISSLLLTPTQVVCEHCIVEFELLFSLHFKTRSPWLRLPCYYECHLVHYPRHHWQGTAGFEELERKERAWQGHRKHPVFLFSQWKLLSLHILGFKRNHSKRESHACHIKLKEPEDSSHDLRDWTSSSGAMVLYKMYQKHSCSEESWRDDAEIAECVESVCRSRNTTTDTVFEQPGMSVRCHHS